MNVPGEELGKVTNRLHDPKDYAGKQVVVVGGGDSALETAIALVCCGSHVTLSYRKGEFSRPKPDNIEKLQELEKDAEHPTGISTPTSDRVTTAASSEMRGDDPPGSLKLLMSSQVKSISEEKVDIQTASDKVESIDNDAVFVMTGREAPLDFFRRSGLPITGEWRIKTWIGFLSFFALCLFVYHWKSGGRLTGFFSGNGWFPFFIPSGDPTTFFGSIINASRDPGFYYSFVYTSLIVIFGFRRIKRRKTPYVTRQTWSLMAFQGNSLISPSLHLSALDG